jgi:hypothetical protein
MKRQRGVYIDVEDHSGPCKPTGFSVIILYRSGGEQLTGQLGVAFKFIQFLIRLSN